MTTFVVCLSWFTAGHFVGSYREWRRAKRAIRDLVAHLEMEEDQ